MFISSNSIDSLPEPGRSELIEVLTSLEIVSLKQDRTLRRLHFMQWVVLTVAVINGGFACWRMLNMGQPIWLFGMNLFTFGVSALVVNSAWKQIARHRAELTERLTRITPWDDYIDWANIPANLRKGGPHA